MDAGLRDRLAAIGLLDAGRMEAARPLSAHLQEWEAALLSKGVTEKHAKQTVGRVRNAFEASEFRHYSEISPNSVRDYLKDLRAPKVETVDGEEVEILGLSAQTSNHILTNCKSFCAWMVREGRTVANPLACLSPLSGKAVKQDARHARRVETPANVARLLVVTAREPERFGMTGPERALLYRLAVESGLRSGELAGLAKMNFNLDGIPPCVVIQDGSTKNGQDADVPLLPATVALLREHFANKMPLTKAFNMPPAYDVADMLKADLKAAQIEYADAAGRCFDFHALRHCTATFLANQGVHPKTVQDIIRHADLKTTLRYFKHTVVAKRAEAMASMPDLSAKAIPEALEATSGGRWLQPSNKNYY